MQTVKPIANTITLNATGNNVFTGKAVYVYNANTTTATTITSNTANNSVTNWTFTLPPNAAVTLVKKPTDLLSSSLTSLVSATSTAFSS